MPRTCSALLGLMLLGTALPETGWAGANANAKILLHVGLPRPAVIDRPCTNVTRIPACSNVVTSGGLYPPSLYRYVYLLVTDGDAAEGVGSMEWGISYNNEAGEGVDIFAWDWCAADHFPVNGPNGAWPASGSGNRLVWFATHCQRFEPGGAGTGVVAVGGYFYVGAYTPDILSITPNPTGGLALVGSCASVVDTVEGGPVVRNPSHLGFARFSERGTEPGYNPCGLGTPVRPTTWGRLKRLPGS
jgi:hypothetical protein